MNQFVYWVFVVAAAFLLSVGIGRAGQKSGWPIWAVMLLAFIISFLILAVAL